MNPEENDEFVIQETFVDFKELCWDMTGHAIATTILEGLRNLGPHSVNLCSEGYDAGGSMAGAVIDACSIILKQYPWPHCCSHSTYSTLFDQDSFYHCTITVTSCEQFLCIT